MTLKQIIFTFYVRSFTCFNTIIHSHLGGCYGVTNAHGMDPPPSQLEATIVGTVFQLYLSTLNKRLRHLIQWSHGLGIIQHTETFRID